MTVNFSTVKSFTTFKGSHNCSAVCPECGRAVHEEPEKSTFTKTKNGFINIRKFFIDCGYMIGGTCKGLVQGVLLGGLTAGAIAVRNIVKRAPQMLGTKGKIITGGVALATLGFDLVKAKLDANQRKAELDHRWETGHNQ